MGKNIILKQHSTYQLIKFPLEQVIREKYDITHEMLSNCAVTFSMFNEETGFYKIANVAADVLIHEDEYYFLDEPTYVLQYNLKKSETNESGIFIGEFKLVFMGENCGTITLPSDDSIRIIIQPSITKVNFADEVELTSTTPTPSIAPYFYGIVSSNGASIGGNRPVASENLVKSGTRVSSSSTGTLSINFNSSFDDYLFFAVPASSPLKTKWHITVLNNGDIGGGISTGGNLFPDPVTLNVNLTIPLLGIVSYSVYISNYQTESTSTMELRNS